MEYRAGLPGCRERAGPVDPVPGPGAQDGHAVHRCGRDVCDSAAVLDVANRVSQRHRRRRRHRLINSIGNLAGFAAPYAMGYLKDATGGFTAGLLVVAFFPFLSAVLVLILGHNPALERGLVPEGAH